ncbi:MAG: DUF2442 domain-containing protein [Deltaproteobacteria bacterium]|nr:DUF2442 domain-containing protein [Deltaproteobacteria bacterium]
MKSESLGEGTSAAEVTNISRHGLWLLVDGEELFLPFDEFPWFKDASLQEILNIERLAAEHLSWPALDIDLTLESIRHPENYPLISKVDTNQSAASDLSQEPNP